MDILYMLFGAFFAPVIHEWTRSITSTALGDPTPRNNGFKTFNPLKFFEPIGFILTLIFHFGWGKPVPTSPVYYKNRNQGVLLTNMLPSLVNLFIGILAIFIASSIDMPLSRWGFIQYLQGSAWSMEFARGIIRSIFFFGFINIGLAFFNLIPVHPLDMHKIMLHFSGPDTIQRLNHYEKPMQIILVLLLVFGLVNWALGPIRDGIIILVSSL